jgi:hypothetical protein
MLRAGGLGGSERMNNHRFFSNQALAYRVLTHRLGMRVLSPAPQGPPNGRRRVPPPNLRSPGAKLSKAKLSKVK